MHTVETTVVMAVVLFCTATVILYAYSLRDRTVCAYVTQEAALDAANIEEAWREDESNLDCVEDKASDQLDTINNLAGCEVEASRNIFGAAAESRGKYNIGIDVDIYDPEEFMRRITLINGLFGKESKNDE